jgi:pyruvate ferredoxin oxidoreductase alpha subunit
MVVPDQEEADAFLPAYEPAMRLDPKNPVTMGPVGMPEVYTEAKVQCEQALLGSKPVVKEVLDRFADQFGRRYELVEKNGKENAKALFLTMGALGETCMTAVDGLIKDGEDVGQVRLRLWRPFPEEEFLEACRGAERIIVIDRALSPGCVNGPLAVDIKSLFYGRDDAPEIVNVIAGLGGRDVTTEDFREIYSRACGGELDGGYTVWGVKSHA